MLAPGRRGGPGRLEAVVEGLALRRGVARWGIRGRVREPALGSVAGGGCVDPRFARRIDSNGRDLVVPEERVAGRYEARSCEHTSDPRRARRPAPHLSILTRHSREVADGSLST